MSSTVSSTCSGSVAARACASSALRASNSSAFSRFFDHGRSGSSHAAAASSSVAARSAHGLLGF
jgi:hypothetical protein